MKIAIGSDHRGYELKTKIISYLKDQNYEVYDCGTNSTENVDYTTYAFKVGESVIKSEANYGIVICGTGIGISIACNKVKGVRCAKVDTIKEAELTRRDNDANVLALNGTMPIENAKAIVLTFLTTEFSHIDRYVRRLSQIAEYENNRGI